MMSFVRVRFDASIRDADSFDASRRRDTQAHFDHFSRHTPLPISCFILRDLFRYINLTENLNGRPQSPRLKTALTMPAFIYSSRRAPLIPFYKKPDILMRDNSSDI
jgi:hypothetical protein